MEPMKKALVICLMIITPGIVTLPMTGIAFAQRLIDIAEKLPRRVGKWNAVAGDDIYDAETIYDYIDGGAEVYKAYNMQGCLSRRYTSEDGPSIILDIFDMGSPEDAFGVFTHDREGNPLDIGQGALFRPGWLSFWKGRFFVSIYMEEETGAAEVAVKKLARGAASCIEGKGQKPKVLLVLPQEGLQVRTIRYVHHHMLLNYHYFLAEENILNLGPETQVALADYVRGTQGARLLIALYSGAMLAREAHRAFLTHYLPEGATEDAVLLENGKWAAAKLGGAILAVVLEADTRELAAKLLREVKTLQ